MRKRVTSAGVALVAGLMLATACAAPRRQGSWHAPRLLASDVVVRAPASQPTASAPPAGPRPAEPAAEAGPENQQPGHDDASADGLRVFLQAVLDHADERASLTASLRPTRADLEALFDAPMAAWAEATYSPAWDAGDMVLQPGRPDRTGILLHSASTDDVSAWRGTAAETFAGGWRRVGPHLRPGHTLWIAKFVVPGQTGGMRFDGFVHVNGSWRIVPKPWRALPQQE